MVDFTYAGTVARREGTAQNPRSTAYGVGQFLIPTWQAYAKANPAAFQGMSPDQVLAARSDPTIALPAIKWLAGQNATILQKYGVQPTGQSLSVAHYLGAYPASAVMKAPDEAKLSDVLTASLGADKTAEYIKANPELGTLTAGQLRNRYVDTPDPSGGTTPGNLGVANANIPTPPIPPEGATPSPAPSTASAGSSNAPVMMALAQTAAGDNSSLSSLVTQATQPLQNYYKSFFDPSNASNV